MLQQVVLVAEGDGRAAPSVVELTQAVESLRECGFEAPSWDRLVEGGKRPPGAANERVPGESLRGWQRSAAASLDASACAGLFLDLDPASRALMLSQAGPCGARALTALPTAPEFRLQSSHFRVLLLRRLRLPLPLAPRQCRCGGALDALGDHRTACPTAGVLGARGAALERAAARVCREAGARVATNAMLRDMNVEDVEVPLADGRRIEVLANGLPRGAADRTPGTAAGEAAARKRRVTYPELANARGGGRQVRS